MLKVYKGNSFHLFEYLPVYLSLTFDFFRDMEQKF